MSEYFDYSTGRLVPGTTARAAAVNTIFDALDTGLDKLPESDHIKRGKLNYAVATGTSNAILVALEYAPTAYEDGMEVVFKATGTNTAAATINVDSLGVKSIRRQDGTVLVAGDITNAKIHTIRYNSTSDYFEIQGSPVGTGGAGTMAAQNASAVAITGGTIGGEDVDDVAAAADYVDNLTVSEADLNTLGADTTDVIAAADYVAAVVSGSSAAGGDYTAGTVSWFSIGKLVVVYVAGLTQVSESASRSSDVVIPAAIRPAAGGAISCINSYNGNNYILGVNTAGHIFTYAVSAAGLLQNIESFNDSSVSYLIA